MNIDPRGILYLVGGAGLFSANKLQSGLSAGAGLTVPVGRRLRGFAEARWLGPLGSRAVASWVVPITIGLR